MKFLIQIHHQFNSGRTELVRQAEIESLDDPDSILQDCKKDHPLPKDAIWLFCKEGAKEFVYARAT